MNFRIGDQFSNQAAQLNIKVAGSNPIAVTVDTGSTGIAIAQHHLPANALDGLTSLGPGAINYDSSGNTPTGNFYELPISILGGTVNGADKVGKTTVKVLVVTSDTTTAYFGIGDNRNNVYSGVFNPQQSFAANVAQGNITQISAVGMNPLINVAVDGVALKHQGYVVQNGGIVVGLTAANNTYSFVKLTPDAANGPNLWNGIPVALSVAGGTYATGTVLHDTGIDYAFIKPFAQVNDTVDISLPGTPDLVQGGLYSFVTPTAPSGSFCTTVTAVTPCKVEGSTSSTPFLNTGRQFYAGFDYLFDPVNGYAGYALSDSGLGSNATLSPLLALIGNVSLQSNFATDLPTYLMGATTLLQTGTGTISSVISGSGGLTIGSGRVDLRGVNTYTGGTTVTGGAILGIGADSRLGDASGGLTLAGGTLLATAAFTSSRAMTMGTGGGTFDTNGFDLVLGTPVSGVGGLTKDGTGILTLSGANSYTGGTVVNDGTLRLATGASLSPIGALVVNGGLFDFNGNNLTVGLLSGVGGTISLG
ncbi:MAG: autotransporter-associated beta strand repeat-containing protein, partial [Reyranella sp.]|nr:autotransporter-associated beta strand repeat-containing protein [Reyranella sp.]